MTRDEIIEMLTAVHPAHEIGCWLRDEYIPEIIRRFNGADSRRRFGLYQGERILKMNAISQMCARVWVS